MTSGSKMRITTFSPKAVGSVETRSSISLPSRSVLIRPSCGRRFSAMSIRHIVFSLEVMARFTSLGTRWISWSTPSMRKRIRACSRLGSMWMSEERES